MKENASLSAFEVKRLAAANYERGGDYIIEMLSDEEISELFCGMPEKEGRKKVYGYMKQVCDMRKYFEQSQFCMA